MDTNYKGWGKSVSVDLYGCDDGVLSDPELIKSFITKLIEVVDMVAHGECYLDRFGVGELEGYSAMQFIETSSIAVHCDEPGKRVFVDLFSCKDFDEKKVETFSKSYFRALKSKLNVLVR